MVSPFSSSSPFNDRPMCRICHEGSSQEDLLSPCECTGTLGTIHRSCLEHWLSSSNTSYCELCHFRFAVERKPRPLVEVSTRGTSPRAQRVSPVCFYIGITKPPPNKGRLSAWGFARQRRELKERSGTAKAMFQTKSKQAKRTGMMFLLHCKQKQRSGEQCAGDT